MKLQLPLMALLVCACTLLSGQKILHKANKQFDLKHYHEAIDSYQKLLDKHPDNLEGRSNLAEAYRMTNQLTKAENAYANIMPEEFVDPIHIRNYGITLMKMAKYNEAHYQFELYKIYNPQDAQHFQLSCEYAQHLYRDANKYEVELVGVNTPNSDFGVAFASDQLIFSSFRNDVELSSDAKKTGQKLTGNMLYTAELAEDLRAENVRFLRSGIAEKKNIGPISFAPQAEICAFTRNKIQNGGAHVTGDDSYHSIYVADLLPNGEWNNERPFRYNEFGTSTGFPSLAFDGSALYFASNRVGGFGGYDIYVSYWKENSWTYPENLGSDINTSGNEITPFFTNEELYFSSDYHHGMGGYDIFHSEVKGGKWMHPENMKNGINSPADDYYPTIKHGTEGIFFSSNRLGGRGMDDIYLAMPVENNEVLASTDFMPEGVTLTEMDSEVLIQNANPQARVVANNEVIEVNVLNPEVEEKIKEPVTEKKEEEELPMWGFVKPTEERASIPSRMDIVINNLERTTLPRLNRSDKPELEHRLGFTTSENDLVNLNRHIAEMEADEPILKEEPIIVATTPEAVKSQGIIAGAIAKEEAKEEITYNAFSNTVEKTDATTQTTEPEQIMPTQTEPSVTKPIIVQELAQTETVTEKPETYKIRNYEAISAKRAPLNLDLAGAKRVALGEILPSSDVFFIQLAALSKSSGNVNKFKHLAKFGNLYKVFKTTSTKIKLGYFLDKEEAKSVLRNVKAQGYNDAFITKDDLVSIQLELIVANDSQKNDYVSYDSNPSTSTKSSNTNANTKTNTAPVTNTIASNEFSLNNTARNSYKIRLASYEDPIWFDIDNAKKLGKIEQWTKGDWTIFILGGYNTYADAEQAMIKAVNKGFADAEIVIDNNGILERLKQN